MNFPVQVFFNNINHCYRADILKKHSLWLLLLFMAAATYCCYEKVYRMLCTTAVSYPLKLLLAFFKLGFTPCNGEQSLQGMELQEKEAQKD